MQLDISSVILFYCKLWFYCDVSTVPWHLEKTAVTGKSALTKGRCAARKK